MFQCSLYSTLRRFLWSELLSRPIAFNDHDGDAGNAETNFLLHELWQSTFGARRDAPGRSSEPAQSLVRPAVFLTLHRELRRCDVDEIGMMT